MADSLFQPRKMSNVSVVNRSRQLDLDPEYPRLILNDEVNFMSTSVFTQVEDLGSGGLRERPYRKGRE